MLRSFLFVVTLIGVQAVVAQTLTLKKAVDIAVERSLAVEQSVLQQRSDEIQLNQSKLNQYPRVSAGSNLGYQFGLNVDPTTNDLVQQRIGFNSFNINAGATLFAAGRIRNSIAQGKQLVASSQAAVDASRQTVSLLTAQNYLEVILAKEQLNVSNSNLKTSEQDLDRIRRLIEAGSAAPVEQYDVESRVARQTQLVTQNQNAVALALLRLRQLLRMSADEQIEVVAPEAIDFEQVQIPATTSAALYQSALTRQPSIRSVQLAEEAAATGIKVAKADYYPTLSAFGQMDTRFSSAAQEVDNFELQNIEQPVTINGTQALLGTVQPTNFTFVNTPYGSQLRDFFGQSIGLSLQVPIFNNGLTNARVEQAKLGLLRAQLATLQEKQSLEIDVQTALQQAIAAKAEVDASQGALSAAQKAFEAAQKSLALGAGSTFDLTNAQLLLEQAQIALIRARYQYLFNVKVVDFYLGRPLQLD